MRILSVLFSQVVQKQMLGEVKKTERPFNGQLWREYVYQKLLKLDDLSPSSCKKNLVCFLCLIVYM